MAGGDKKWDGTAERDLCISVILAAQEGRLTYNWARAHAIMTKMGYPFTKDALSQHFTKAIMKDVKARYGDVLANVGPARGGSAPSTPKKASTPAKRKAAAAAAAAAAKSSTLGDAVDDAPADASPAKKVKVKPADGDAEDKPAVKRESPAARARSVTVKPDDPAFQTWLHGPN